MLLACFPIDHLKVPRLTVHAQTYGVLDDIVSNIVHDICLQTHREEKIARANSAAIRIEAQAANTDPDTSDSSRDRQGHKIELEGVSFHNGEVTLKGNPLETTPQILCPNCGLPRLLYPTEGKGARPPAPGIEYCKKRPFIDNGPYFDIYGQTFEPNGPGRGKKKKDMINPLLQQAAKEGTPGGSQDSSPPPGTLGKPIPTPSAKCENCSKHYPIKRMNNHMSSCIGGGGREASRNALTKIQNGNGNGSNGNTPPGSRNGTPVPGTKRNSPSKRSPGDDFDSDTPQKKKKLIIKNKQTIKLKAPKMVKSLSQHSASNLSFESKAPHSEEDEDDNDDERDGDFGSIAVEPKKKIKPTAKKLKDMTTKKKWLYGKDGKGGPIKPGLPPILPPEVAKVKQKRGDGDSPGDSSQTLSSPNE